MKIIDCFKAVELLMREELVIVPTETVYGLGADAYSDNAVRKIFLTKKRPFSHSLIAHYGNIEMMKSDVVLCEKAAKLAKKFWPGPLTLVLHKSNNCKISKFACLSSAAVRIPANEKFLSIIKLFGNPIAAPSANRYEHISPTTARDAIESLGGNLPVVDNGKCRYGIESTILDITNKIPKILRHGAVLKTEIEDVIGCYVDENSKYEETQGAYRMSKSESDSQIFVQKAGMIDCSDEISVTFSGTKLKHYCPNKPLRMNAINSISEEGLLAFGKIDLTKFHSEVCLNLSESESLEEAAQNLFEYMYKLDRTKCKSIAVMDIPNIGYGTAVNDKLKRASR